MKLLHPQTNQKLSLMLTQTETEETKRIASETRRRGRGQEHLPFSL